MASWSTQLEFDLSWKEYIIFFLLSYVASVFSDKIFVHKVHYAKIAQWHGQSAPQNAIASFSATPDSISIGFSASFYVDLTLCFFVFDLEPR